MKKTLAVLAVLAVAAAAQADLVASWGIDGKANGTGEDYKYLTGSKIGVTDMSAYKGGTLKTSTTQGTGDFFQLTNLNRNNGAGMSFGFTVEEGYTITGASIVGDIGITKAGSATTYWYTSDPETASGSADHYTHATSSSTVRDSAYSQSLGDLSGSGTIYFVGSTTRLDAGTGNANGDFRFYAQDEGAVQLRGTTTGGDTPTPPSPSVPEPATMSLLGIGALAMALRRKLRK